MLPPFVVLDPIISAWLREDIGRGDRTTDCLFANGSPVGRAEIVAKEAGVIAGLPIAKRSFYLLDPEVEFKQLVEDGTECEKGQKIATIAGSLSSLLTGERVALNILMQLSGISSLTREYGLAIADLPTQLVDTRKTTPGLRLFEKYATQVGGAINHRLGLDDAVMIKDNHIIAAGGITKAVQQIRAQMPFTTTIEVETENIDQVKEALLQRVDIIMLDNMSAELMSEAIALIRSQDPKVKIEASGNITIVTIRSVAELEVDYISTSAMVARSRWLDLSMNIN
ncbi:nicotinate-nucleotide pyrophosphorylase (carboxylating) [Thalassoporum mexicanum PCC 7367]|uniref:carboxylating nicotinate-nucleotide diphosphorylase n=1 Tax=Thalassoporum mexicanum TaxID=3457544 RepID=UPI00029FF570|nr:carboxylating nicotinate-nucleotide diphosphorylase [Pseudanabaena sp. PCC 7367]AFY70515.1 nicotinate-nucleotide pyrophosphorylase (carboxylating) [Pseudanabaena sp. PCC 7367]